jgi:2-C-methyl-D-erythritol 4-phosphate cytidylyltransferase/2-C-methyl-D-erythritol 2,4-cyclodiphosphate synthase
VEARGGVIVHVDLTLLCEAPRIGPHRDAMRGSIAEMLGLGLDQVSIKATTNEGLGFIGRGEGIAAMATATVRLP